MQFKNYAQKTVSYEKKMQIEENRMKVEMTLDSLRSYLQCANIFNVETDSLYKQIASVVDLSNRSNYFIDQRQGPQTEAQKKMMYNIEHISDYAQEGIKMNLIVTRICLYCKNPPKGGFSAFQSKKGGQSNVERRILRAAESRSRAHGLD